MGRGGDMFRTWSGPGGSSHKGPLTSALSYSECFILQAATSRLLAAWASSCKDAMDIINFFISLLSDPRSAIAGWIVALGAAWVYTPLFLIVFVETGLVFFPFLPGDSLLFAAGVFSADGGGLHLWATLIVFYAAAILGNTSNYWIARFFGKRIIDSGKIKALTPERMAKLIIASVDQNPAPLRLMLGARALKRSIASLKKRLAEYEKQADTAALADFPETQGASDAQ